MAFVMEPVRIEMFLDVSCPWCHGALETSRRLLDELSADPTIPPVELRWRFMRLHDMPRPGGLPLDEYFATWGDDPEAAVAAAHAEVLAFAASVGVRVDFDRHTWLHDPHAAHALLASVRDDAGDDLPNLWSVARAIFTANFVAGADVTDLATLRTAVHDAGLVLPDRIWRAAASDGASAAVDADHERALEVELDGVPRMYVGGVIVPTWIAPDEVRQRLREAISSASAPSAPAPR